MRFKDRRQHRKKPDPNFRVLRDRFDNLTLIGEWQGMVLKSGPFCENILRRAQKQMIKAFSELEKTVAS